MSSFQGPLRTDGTPRIEQLTEFSRTGLSSPLSSPSRLKLSSPAPSGSGLPKSSAKVAMRSAWWMSCPLTLPGFTTPGQRTMKGTRWPPSQASDL